MDAEDKGKLRQQSDMLSPWVPSIKYIAVIDSPSLSCKLEWLHQCYAVGKENHSMFEMGYMKADSYNLNKALS